MIWFWNQREPRERLLLSGLLILTATLLISHFGIFRNLERIKTSEKRIKNLRRDLGELNDFYKQYKNLKSKEMNSNVSSAKGTKSILTIVDGIIQESQLKSNVRNINGPSTVTIKEKYKKKVVEIKIETVFINQIIEFIYAVENFPTRLFVEYFFIRDAYNKPGLYDFTIRISRVVKS